MLCFIRTSSPYPGYKMLSRLLLAHLCIYAATFVMHTSCMWCTGLMGIHAQLVIYMISYCIFNILTASLEMYMIRYIWTSSPYLDCEMSSRQLLAHLCIYAATVMMHSSRVECTQYPVPQCVLTISPQGLGQHLVSCAYNIQQGASYGPRTAWRLVAHPIYRR